MSKYYLVHGELHSDDELYHWKYIKRERIGGKWVYTYPWDNAARKLGQAIDKKFANKDGNRISRLADDARYKAKQKANKAEYEAKKLANKGERDMNRYKLGLDNGKLSLNKTIDPKNEARYLAKNVSAGAKFVAKTASNIALSELNKIGNGKADNKIQKAVNKGKKFIEKLPEKTATAAFAITKPRQYQFDKALSKSLENIEGYEKEQKYKEYVKNVEKRNAETAKKKEEHMKKLAEAKEKEKKEKEAQDRVDEMLRKRRHGIWY